MNLTTDILIVNQCDENKYEERVVNGRKQRMIYTTQRGLSQSRNELLNNMEGDIGIDMGCDDGLLKIVITDNGIPFNPLETREPDITLPLEERPIGGLGIFLVKQLMTDVRYDRSEGKNRLTMTKEIQ